MRIEDPDTGEPLGVMKSVLPIEPVQHIADRTAQTISGGRVQVATGSGALIAETSSGHDRERIMSSEVDVSEQGGESVLAAFAGGPMGFVTDSDWITGYARTGGRDTYAAVARQFSGFDWIVILQRPLAGIHEPLSALRAIETALDDWRTMLGIGFVATALVSIILAVALSNAVARRLSASLQAVRELAERTARGESVAPAAISRPAELVQVNHAVHRLGRVFMTVLRRSQPRHTPRLRDTCRWRPIRVAGDGPVRPRTDNGLQALWGPSWSLKSFPARQYENVRCPGEVTYDRFESPFMKVNSLVR